MKRALITGITGQDGSLLTEFLLARGYEVHGIIRRASTFNTERIDHLYVDPHVDSARLHLHYGDLVDGTALRRIVDAVQPHEVYNLAAQSHVKVSFENPEYTVEVIALGTLRLLEAVREYNTRSETKMRYYQAGTSEMYGSSPPPQSEATPFRPRSPYAAAKLYAHWQTINYRESYGLFACNGILFNHESERRGETFVTRKITRAATRIKLGLQREIYLGNTHTLRDWGYAPDYVEAMWLMLQRERPDDYVVATGQMHSVEEFLTEAFGCLDLDWKDYVRIDPRYYRPTEVEALCGDSSKAKKELHWEPRVSFKQLVVRMVESDLRLAQREANLRSVEGWERRNPNQGE